MPHDASGADPDPSSVFGDSLRDVGYMRDMLEAAREVVSFASGKTWEQYQSDTQLRRAIERSVEIIGEAARRVSPACQARHSNIPWGKISPQRHRLAHEYDRIDDSIIWSVASRHVPTLIPQLEAILPQDPA